MLPEVSGVALSQSICVPGTQKDVTVGEKEWFEVYFRATEDVFPLFFFMCPFPKDPPHFCVSAQQTPTLYKHTVNPCTVPTIDLPAPPASSSCAHSQHFSAVFVSAMKSIACMGKSYVSLANFQIILLKGGMGGEEELLAVEGA